jgi:hypothetical protein
MEKNWGTGRQHPESHREKASKWLESSLAWQSIPGSRWRLSLELQSVPEPPVVPGSIQGWPLLPAPRSELATRCSLVWLEVPGWGRLTPGSRVPCSVQELRSWKAAHWLGQPVVAHNWREED